MRKRTQTDLMLGCLTESPRLTRSSWGVSETHRSEEFPPMRLMKRWSLPSF
jgi:hypothetical protein